ncbi:redoxin domain-containing protein [Pedobacter faecalis]|uniref:redoxin domain-containing protein n=1 Tax=Pedobacter faecalis TaxID=3041495 RepID=UPI00254D9FC7|nr:redoxin domain-containing protein [Pedobacter sp. ELA7]
MKKISIVFLIFMSALCSSLRAQEQNSLMEQVKVMAKEKDPEKVVAMMNKIIADNKLDNVKDAETMDMLKGTAAMAYLGKKQYPEFRKYIGQLRNKFNQTSYLNMAASTLLREDGDPKMAEQLSKETLDLYFSYKDDPAARPAEMGEADWKRFMDFAKYPYYDTYAAALFANGKYKEALANQEKAFDSTPEEAMAPSAERYARLLALNGQPDKAYKLLETLISTGKSTAAMDAQLKELYVKKQGSEAGFDEYLKQLQQGVQSVLKTSLASKMLDTIAPGFVLKDLTGKTVSLSDYRGKVVVLDFWATWCVPCIASFPAMQKMVSKHDDVVFLFIATQEKEAGALERVKSFVDKNKYSFHVLMDKPIAGKAGAYEALAAYKVKGIPTKAIIDKKGKLRFLSVGFTTDSELINELEAMMELAAEKSS